MVVATTTYTPAQREPLQLAIERTGNAAREELIRWQAILADDNSPIPTPFDPAVPRASLKAVVDGVLAEKREASQTSTQSWSGFYIAIGSSALTLFGV